MEIGRYIVKLLPVHRSTYDMNSKSTSYKLLEDEPMAKLYVL
jgi:hypothetical protein